MPVEGFDLQAEMQRHEPTLASHIKQHGLESDAEDIRQELACELVGAHRRGQEPIPVSHRVRTLVRRTVDAQRQPPLMAEPVADPSEWAVARDLLRWACKRLGPREQVLVGAVFAGWSGKEIARRYGFPSESAVHTALHRARTRIRNGAGGVSCFIAGCWKRVRRRVGNTISPARASVAEATQNVTVPCLVLLAIATPQVGAAAAAPLPRPTVSVGRLSSHPAPLRAEARAQTDAAGHKPEAPIAPARRAPALDEPHGTGATSETPEDVDMYALAAAPGGSDALYGTGPGGRCKCDVLLRSPDGGTTWEANQGAPNGSGLAFAPAFPSDPRLLIGTPPASGTPPSLVSRFGDPAQSLAPLPAGHVAFVSPTMVLSAGLGAVYEDDLSTGLVVPVITYPASSTPAEVSSVAGTTFVWAPAGSVLVGVPAVAAGVQPALAVTSKDSLLFACSADGCQLRGAVPLGGVGVMTLSAEYTSDRSLILGWNSSWVVSRDDGRSFAVVPHALPGQILSMGLTPGTAGDVWVLSEAAGAAALSDGSLFSQAPWVTVPATPTLAELHEIVVLGPDLVAGVSRTVGFSCSANGGRTWESRCPV